MAAIFQHSVAPQQREQPAAAEDAAPAFRLLHAAGGTAGLHASAQLGAGSGLLRHRLHHSVQGRCAGQEWLVFAITRLQLFV